MTKTHTFKADLYDNVCEWLHLLIDEGTITPKNEILFDFVIQMLTNEISVDKNDIVTINIEYDTDIDYCAIQSFFVVAYSAYKNKDEVLSDNLMRMYVRISQ
jgi:hypothetical protein